MGERGKEENSRVEERSTKVFSVENGVGERILGVQ